MIVGFTAPKKTRPFFGALTLAVHEGNGWRYAGHVGTGFSHAVLKGYPEKGVAKLLAIAGRLSDAVSSRGARP